MRSHVLIILYMYFLNKKNVYLLTIILIECFLAHYFKLLNRFQHVYKGDSRIVLLSDFSNSFTVF